MICHNCGLQNRPGAERCGSCGFPLAAPPLEERYEAADASTAPDTDQTAVPRVSSRPAQRSWNQAVPVAPSRSDAGVSGLTHSVVCRNCGRANPPSRSVCHQCGRRLVVAAGVRTGRGRQPRTDNAAEFLPTGASVVVFILALAAVGALLGMVLLGGGGPQPTLDAFAGASPTPALAAVGTASPLGVAPTERPTFPPVTDAPVTQPPTTGGPASPMPASPPPGAFGCASSEVETDWLNLTRDDSRQRLSDESAWCVHEVAVVPYYGFGRIRLLVDGEPVALVEHGRGSDEEEYTISLPSPLLVEPGSMLGYQFRCDVAECAAVIQVGYDEVAAP